MAPDCVGPEVEAMAKALKPGDVLMLENTRFHKEEEKNDLEFAKQMASLGDVYVNDAFGSAHRAHASTEGVARYLPAVSGFLMEQELEYPGPRDREPRASLRGHPGRRQDQRQDRWSIENLLTKCDKLIIGGGMANTFLAAKGYNMQDSLVEADASRDRQGYPEQERRQAAAARGRGHRRQVRRRGQQPGRRCGQDPGRLAHDGYRPEDASPSSATAIKGAKLVVWNGPMGVFEMPKFAEGTFAIAQAAGR